MNVLPEIYKLMIYKLLASKKPFFQIKVLLKYQRQKMHDKGNKNTHMLLHINNTFIFIFTQ